MKKICEIGDIFKIINSEKFVSQTYYGKDSEYMVLVDRYKSNNITYKFRFFNENSKPSLFYRHLSLKRDFITFLIDDKIIEKCKPEVSARIYLKGVI